MLGASWQQRAAESVEATSQNFSDDFYQWHNLGAGTVTIPSKSDDYAWSINSYFARINYTLKVIISIYGHRPLRRIVQIRKE